MQIFNEYYLNYTNFTKENLYPRKQYGFISIS